MIFSTFLIIPLLICLGSWLFTDKITWKEVGIQVVVQILLIGIMSYALLQANISDTEVWNGLITKKWNERVPCRHSYPCNCHEVCHLSCSGGKNNSCHNSCHTVCQTCYRHPYDIDWMAQNNINENWSINTIDEQGLREPPRWAEIQIGEPTSSTHNYDNYIKGSPNSLFYTEKFKEEDFKELPKYPLSIRDYWKLNRLIQIGVSLPDMTEWNKEISKISGDLGSKKQVNVVVVIARNKDHNFFNKLQRYWMGGKKNDVIPVIGVDDNNNIIWVEVMSLSNEEFKVYLKNDILTLDTLDRNSILKLIKENIENKYIRKPMKDFEYLKNSIKPTKGQWIFGLILGIAISVGLSLFFYYQDPFGDNKYNY